MKYILDTNIVVTLIRSKDFKLAFRKKYQFTKDDFLISAVTQGEALSLSKQWKWGRQKLITLHDSLQNFIIYPIKVEQIITAYAQIDAYSQGKLPEKPLPYGMSSRNMGKNDLWIAATANVMNATLITTDKDFGHLQNSFLNLDEINLSSFGNP